MARPTQAPTTTLQHVLLSILRVFSVVVGLIAAIVILLPLYGAYVFPWLTPMRALGAIFQNPRSARVVTTEQQGAFARSGVYVADALVEGDLKLRANLYPTAGEHIRGLVSQKHLCDDILQAPANELHYFHNFIGSPVPGPQPKNVQAFVVEHRPSHSFCFHFVQVPE